jgi:hypothetical protein
MTEERLKLIEKLIEMHKSGLDAADTSDVLEGWVKGHFWCAKSGTSGWAPDRGSPARDAAWEWRAKDDEDVPGLADLLPELIAFARSKL